METRESLTALGIQKNAMSGFVVFVLSILLLAVPIWLLGDVMYRERGRPGFSPRALFVGACIAGAVLLLLLCCLIFFPARL